MKDKRWVLIFDDMENVQDMQPFLPSEGRVLITTRFKDQALRVPGTSRKLDLNTLSEKDAIEMFQANLHRFSTQQDSPEYSMDELQAFARVLMDEMGGHALGIEQTAAYIQYKGLHIEQFLKNYERMADRIHEQGHGNIDGNKSLATLWEIHFQNINELEPDEDENFPRSVSVVMSVISMLSANSIPLSLFTPEDDDVLLSLSESLDEIFSDEDL